jgi:hypothetical protein
MGARQPLEKGGGFDEIWLIMKEMETLPDGA